ncbi:Nucleoid occlusion protein [subsurface metagenome]
MKIKIKNIEIGKFSIRDKFYDVHIKEIKDSFKIDGQWNPIIVKPIKNGRYDLIAGHYRLQAAKELGWEEIEANIKDLEEIDADVLSLKTNIMHSEMSPTEKGKVINKIITTYGITQRELSKKLGISETQISKLLTLALSLHKFVADALNSGKINYGVASIIGSLDINRQQKFLELILQKKITQPAEASGLKAKFLNDTIFTIGYEGRNSDDFIEILKNNNIKTLIDVRYSAKSERKPQFNKDILKKELERNEIGYIHYPELGIPYLIQSPYKEGKFSFDCLKQWYYWHIETEVEFEKIMKFLKETGKPVIMCMEKYAKKMRDQKYACHRDILAEMILTFSSDDNMIKFEHRSDL